MAYDKADNLLVERLFRRRPGGALELLRRTEYRYDERGLRIAESRNLFAAPLPVTDPAAAYLATPGPGILLRTHRFYDARDRLVRHVDATGATTATEYDSLGRERVRTDALANETRRRYDAHGNVLRVDTVERLRDPVTGAVTGSSVFSVEHTCDELGRRVRTVRRIRQ